MAIKIEVIESIEVIQTVIANCGAQTFIELASEVYRLVPSVETPSQAQGLTKKALKELLEVNRLRSRLVDGVLLYSRTRSPGSMKDNP
jgi:predicted RecB family endonuclease